MLNETLVTIIIPVAEAHVNLLPHALSSLTNQSVQAHQIIVVNDTGRALRCDNGAKVINTPGHVGQSIARNMGIEKTETPFIFFLDADDTLFTTTLETLIRAYANTNANYLYGDSLQVSGNKEEYFTAPLYDRYRYFTNNLHNVNALLPTESVKQIGGFDEQIKGWEDWEFFIRMNVNGFCGAKVPMPLIVYHVDTGISRESHRRFQDEIGADVQRIYNPYITRKVELMSCCGSNKIAQQAAQAFVQGLPPDVPVDGFVMMEFMGAQTGTVPFRVGTGDQAVTYRGANDSINKFVRVKAEHVAELESRGMWRKAPSSILRAQRPEEAPITTPPQARRVNATPESVTRSRNEDTALDLSASVSLITCADCGHIINFHMPQVGCQAIQGNDVCGCKQFVASKEKTDEPEDSGRTPTRARKSRRNARAHS